MERDDSFPGTQAYDEGERELLRGVRALVQADRDMRRAIGARMALGESDVRAVRLVMAASREDRPMSPHDIAAQLGMTTAAVTTLLDRLVAAGHVRRTPHPTDGRSKVVLPTRHAYEEVQQMLATMHDGMRSAAAAVPEESRTAVVTFLEELTEVMRAEVGRR